MKCTLLLLAICLALGLVSALRNASGDKPVNRPKFDVFGSRQKRALDGVKGGVRVHPLFNFKPTGPPALGVRKGEYICGDKVCKLKPGVVPPGCNGVCQYPIL